MGGGVSWKVGSGSKVLVGIDPIIGLVENYMLFLYLLASLVELGFITLAHSKQPT